MEKIHTFPRDSYHAAIITARSHATLALRSRSQGDHVQASIHVAKQQEYLELARTLKEDKKHEAK